MTFLRLNQRAVSDCALSDLYLSVGVYSYGFQWYPGTSTSFPSCLIIAAAGNGSLRLMIFPEQQLALTVLAGNYDGSRQNSAGRMQGRVVRAHAYHSYVPAHRCSRTASFQTGGLGNECPANLVSVLVRLWRISLKKAGPNERPSATRIEGHRSNQTGSGFSFGIGSSFASFRRFWAMAARWNSSLAPVGPRNLRRPRPRIRLR